MNLFTGTESPDSPHTRNRACFSAIRNQYYCRSFLLFCILGQQGSIETLPEWRLFCGSFSFSMNIGVSLPLYTLTGFCRIISRETQIISAAVLHESYI